MSGDTLTLICWNTTMVADVLAGRMENPLPPAVGEIQGHWNALCSLDVRNLEEASDVWKNMAANKVPKDQREDIMKGVREKWQVRIASLPSPASLPSALSAVAVS
jgi:hypothetical protein